MAEVVNFLKSIPMMVVEEGHLEFILKMEAEEEMERCLVFKIKMVVEVSRQIALNYQAPNSKRVGEVVVEASLELKKVEKLLLNSEREEVEELMLHLILPGTLLP